MFSLSLSWLPTLVALCLFLLTLYYKRATIRTNELAAYALVTLVIFLLLSGAFNALHLPNIALHLF